MLVDRALVNGSLNGLLITDRNHWHLIVVIGDFWIINVLSERPIMWISFTVQSRVMCAAFGASLATVGEFQSEFYYRVSVLHALLK